VELELDVVLLVLVDVDVREEVELDVVLLVLVDVDVRDEVEVEVELELELELVVLVLVRVELEVDVELRLELLEVLVDVLVELELEDELEDELDVEELELVDEVGAVLEYSSNRLPAPQYSYWLPGHLKLQSAKGATLLDGSTAFPHQPSRIVCQQYFGSRWVAFKGRENSHSRPYSTPKKL
jgi:hypothetical protein